MQKINEGMRRGDLEDLVLPMISVDEFESKIDDNAVVFGFWVQDSDAAMDLNRFIQKSAVTLLDTEVSPAPDKRGKYFVFFEMMNDKDMAENVKKVLDEVGELTKIKNWQLRIRGREALIPFEIDALQSLGDENSNKQITEGIFEFLRESQLSYAEIKHNVLHIQALGYSHKYNILGFGNFCEINEKYNLKESANDLSFHEFSKLNRLERMLGEGWDIRLVNKTITIQREGQDDILVLREY